MSVLETKVFEFRSKTLHLLPFGGHRFWRGFKTEQSVTITDAEITIRDGAYTATIPTDQLEYVQRENRFFNLRNPKIYVGYFDEAAQSYKGDWFYISKSDYKTLITVLKSKNTICYAPHSIEVKKRNNDRFWLNPYRIFSSNDIRSKGVDCYVRTADVKYIYETGMWWKHVFIGGDDGYAELDWAQKGLYAKAKEYIMLHSKNLRDMPEVSYKNCWSFNVLYSPSLWFSRSEIGFADDGVVYMQRTFKTNETIFMPYDKINMGLTGKGLFSRKLKIYGEQNILPKRKYSTSTTKKILEELERRGVSLANGNTYTPSIFRHGWEVPISIVIVPVIIRCIINLFKKRSEITITKKVAVCQGEMYYSGSFSKSKDTNLAFECKDVCSVIYRKKHWYHWWGYLAILVHPSNIRAFAGEASQASHRYIFVMHKVWSGTASSIENSLTSAGYTADDSDSDFENWFEDYVDGKK